MELRATNARNFGFVFSTHEMSAEEKTVKAKQAFMDSVRQASASESRAEKSNKQNLADIQETLTKIKSNFKLDKDEWIKLLGVLRDEGKISQDDYQLASVGYSLIPLGYKDANGNFVKYDTESVMAKRMSLTAQGAAKDGWDGDPIQYLDNWIASMRNWKSDMLLQRNPDGTPKYNNFEPLDKQISSISKVLNALLAML